MSRLHTQEPKATRGVTWKRQKPKEGMRRTGSSMSKAAKFGCARFPKSLQEIADDMTANIQERSPARQLNGRGDDARSCDFGTSLPEGTENSAPRPKHVLLRKITPDRREHRTPEHLRKYARGRADGLSWRGPWGSGDDVTGWLGMGLTRLRSKRKATRPKRLKKKQKHLYKSRTY